MLKELTAERLNYNLYKSFHVGDYKRGLFAKVTVGLSTVC